MDINSDNVAFSAQKNNKRRVCVLVSCDKWLHKIINIDKILNFEFIARGEGREVFM